MSDLILIIAIIAFTFMALLFLRSVKKEKSGVQSISNSNQNNTGGFLSKLNNLNSEFESAGFGKFKMFNREIDYRYILFLLILIMGIVVRVYNISGVPAGLNQDEAYGNYETYALVNYGVDSNGMSFPVHFVSWGSGMNTLYAYLTMPLIKIFGLNETTAILGNLIFCILSMIVIFFTVKRLKNLDLALLATFIMAVSPWHIMIARWGLLENIFPAVVLIGVAFYSKYLKNPKYVFAFSAVMSLSLYAYGPAYFVIPALLAIVAIYEAYFAKSKIQWFKTYLKAFVCFVVIAIPIVLFVYINIISPTSKTIHLGPITVPKLVEAGYRYNQVVFLGGGNTHLWETLKENYAVFYDTVFKQIGFSYNVIDKFGTIYRISNFFFFIGLFASILATVKSFIEKKMQTDFVFLVWFILSCILGVVNNTNTNRINIIFIPMMYLTAYGIYVFTILLSTITKYLIKSISTKAQKYGFNLAKLVTLIIIAVLYLNNFSAFANYYFTEYPDEINQMFHESFDDALLYVVDKNSDKRDVYVTNFNGAFTLVLFYTKYDPREFYRTVNYLNPYTEFRPVGSFGNYKFINIEGSIEAADNAYYIVENYQVNNLTGVKTPKDIKQFKRFTVLEY